MIPRGETAPLCPLVRDALDRRVHPIGEALVDGARAWAYFAEGGGGDEVGRVTRAPGTAVAGPLTSEHTTRAEAIVAWRWYLGRMMLTGRVVTERRPGEDASAWMRRDRLARERARGPAPLAPSPWHRPITPMRDAGGVLQGVWNAAEGRTTCLVR